MKSIFLYNRAEIKPEIVVYPDGFKASDILDEDFCSTDFIDCNEELTSIFLDGIHIEFRDIALVNPYHVDVKHDFPFLKMQFELEGYSLFNSNIRSVDQVEINGGTHQLFYLPEVNGRLEYFTNRSTLEIKLTPDYLFHVFNYDLSPLKEFGKAVSTNSSGLLSSKSMPVTTDMKNCIMLMRNCGYRGVMKKIYLDCKVKELLLMQIEQHEQFGRQLQQTLKRREIDQLHDVKEIIHNHLDNPKTIIELAEMVGVNDCTLKRNFKAHFGCTLFGYLTETRLEKAKDLILSGRTISETSYLVGYKHQQHFTHAFKKYFGHLPGELKKEGSFL